MGGGHFYSETKEARTMELCTVIAYYITSTTKQFKFVNSYCFVVCSYCSVVCLIVKHDVKQYQPYPWYQNPCDASIFLQARPNFREKVKNLILGQTLTFL